MRPVARSLEQLGAGEQRRFDFDVTVAPEHAAHGLLQRVIDDRALRQPERSARHPLVRHEKLKLAPELAVVALFGLLDVVQVLFKLLFSRPHGPVDALQHGVSLAAAPVSPCNRSELEMLALARARDVRACAQVREIAYRVGRNRIARDAVYKLHLEVLVARAEKLQGFILIPVLAVKLQALLYYLAHAALYLGQVFGRERARKLHIIIKAVLDRRPDAEFNFGENLLNRRSHYV